MANLVKIAASDAGRHCVTIGEVDQLAGIGQSDVVRFTFWRQFSRLKEAAFEADRAELHRLVKAQSI